MPNRPLNITSIHTGSTIRGRRMNQFVQDMARRMVACRVEECEFPDFNHGFIEVLRHMYHMQAMLESNPSQGHDWEFVYSECIEIATAAMCLAVETIPLDRYQREIDKR